MREDPREQPRDQPRDQPGSVFPDAATDAERAVGGSSRHVAPGGVLRMVIGFACGLAAGAVVALLLPRDDGPRRGSLVYDDVVPDAPEPSGAFPPRDAPGDLV